MMPEEEPQGTTEAPPETSHGQRPRRGRGRGRRSHHGRRRPQGEHPPSEATATEEPAKSTATSSEATPEVVQARHREGGFQKQAPIAAVTQAIDEVNRIIATLKETLADMEDVLETLELAERQKTADEQEIEILRRGLRQLHRPRDAGSSHNREQTHEPH